MNQAIHSAIREDVLRRIRSGEWPLGSRIPDEKTLAVHYGCARGTVNRALRALAEEGVVVRRRKGGTRVRTAPVRQARLAIPIIREQVETLGGEYAHEVLTRRIAPPPKAARAILGSPEKALYLETVHRGDGAPFAFERRWINVDAIPEAANRRFERMSSNEWLVKTVPLSGGDLTFRAVNAVGRVAKALAAAEGAALFALERTTRLEEVVITTVQIYYREGYRMQSHL